MTRKAFKVSRDNCNYIFIMNEKNKNEEIQTRREFFKKAAKATLPVLGAVVLSSIPLAEAKAQFCGCGYSCSNSCHTSCGSGCGYGCSGSCKGGCGGCKGACMNSCTRGNYL